MKFNKEKKNHFKKKKKEAGRTRTKGRTMKNNLKYNQDCIYPE
jgi:hypothetical protein